ncbi:MAG: hypothetical protein AABZ47_02120 [Planctomycetota bacterium]
MSKLPFAPKAFFIVFAIVTTLLLTGFLVAQRLTGELALRDIIGASLSALIFTYLVHLWLLPADDSPNHPASDS